MRNDEVKKMSGGRISLLRKRAAAERKGEGSEEMKCREKCSRR